MTTSTSTKTAQGEPNSGCLETPPLALGLLLCATAAGHTFDRASFIVDALEEGGDQFVSGTSQTVSTAVAADGVDSLRPFSGAAAWNHRAVEVGVAADVLGTDPHYAATYTRRRYDELTSDAAGAALAGVVQDAVTVDAATASSALIAQLDSTALTDSERVGQGLTLVHFSAQLERF